MSLEYPPESSSFSSFTVHAESVSMTMPKKLPLQWTQCALCSNCRTLSPYVWLLDYWNVWPRYRHKTLVKWDRIVYFLQVNELNTILRQTSSFTLNIFLANAAKLKLWIIAMSVGEISDNTQGVMNIRTLSTKLMHWNLIAGVMELGGVFLWEMTMS